MRWSYDDTKLNGLIIILHKNHEKEITISTHKRNCYLKFRDGDETSIPKTKSGLKDLENFNSVAEWRPDFKTMADWMESKGGIMKGTEAGFELALKIKPN